MSSSLRTSLPFTVALAIVVYLVSIFLPEHLLSQAAALTLGVVIAGVLIPLLMEYKSLPTSSATKVVKSAGATVSGDTATLYVGNLPYRANEEAVRELFQQSGAVVNVRLMKDRQTGRRRGFGFVEVAVKDANKMIQKLNDFEFEGRTLKVREAKERQDSEDGEE
ncbi:MAG: RNA-binding protein [Gammaproteobacteria bacterium]|nr:RNA-binding protein [Gammaproteobacteria bacterium]MBU2178713.1 RNA-binding protein [Gammaproteobacteria bacterium]MBU2222812.1 RNA-binding protein [Gammaproteobacteria bacterium]MBU2277561.1 RNA-binding protein [Gammaproteobacteria bacterium]